MCVFTVYSPLFVGMYAVVEIYNFMTIRRCLHIFMCVGVCVHNNSASSMEVIHWEGQWWGWGWVQPVQTSYHSQQGHQNLRQDDLHSLCMQVPVTCIPLDSTRVSYHCTSHDRWSPVHDIWHVLLHVCYSTITLPLQNWTQWLTLHTIPCTSTLSQMVYIPSQQPHDLCAVHTTSHVWQLQQSHSTGMLLGDYLAGGTAPPPLSHWPNGPTHSSCSLLLLRLLLPAWSSHKSECEASLLSET